jgi:hypothetical protein
MNIFKKTRDAAPEDIARAAMETKLEMMNTVNDQMALCKSIFFGDEIRSKAFTRGLIKAAAAELIMGLLLTGNELPDDDSEIFHKDLEKYYEETHLESMANEVMDAVQKVIDENTEIPKPNKYRGMGRRN